MKVKAILGLLAVLLASMTVEGASGALTSFEDAASLYLTARGEMARMTPPSLPLDVEDIVEGMENEDYTFLDLPQWYVLFLLSKEQSFLQSPAAAIGVYEDLASGEIVVLSETQQVLAAFAAPPLPATGTVEEWEAELHMRRFVLWLQFEEPDVSPPALLRSGAPPSSQYSGGDDFRIRDIDFSFDRKAFSMTIGVSTSFTGKVDIYETDDLEHGQWVLSDVSVPVYGGEAIWYPLIKSVRGDMKFYFAADGSTDSDGDGYPDSYEMFVLGTDPLNASSVASGISDGPYWPGGTIQAGPASILIQEDAMDENPMEAGTLSVFNPRAKDAWPAPSGNYTSLYSSIAVAGNFNDWSTTAWPLTRVADHQWEGTILVQHASPAFKFAANGGWITSWGQSGNAIHTLPVENSASGGNDILLQGPLFGYYKFTFCETSLVYRVEAGTPPRFTVSSAGRMLWYADGANAGTGFGQIHGGIFFNHDEENLYVGVAGFGNGGNNMLLILLDTDGETGGVSTLAGLSGNPPVLGHADNLSFGSGFTPNVALIVGDRRINNRNASAQGSHGQGVYAISSNGISDFPGFSPISGKLLQWGDRNETEANAGIIAALSRSALGLTSPTGSLQAAAIICGGVENNSVYFSGEAYGATANGNLGTNANFGNNNIILASLPVTLVTNEAPERSTAQLFTEDDVMLQGFYWDVPFGGVTNWYVHLQNQLEAGVFDNFTHIWMPPPSKGKSSDEEMGNNSVGYDPYDYYDIGSYNYKFSTRTRYGVESEQRALVDGLRARNIQPIVDLVLNHMNGGEISGQGMTASTRYNYEYPYHKRFQKSNINNTNQYFNVNFVDYPFGNDNGWGLENPSNASNPMEHSADINHRNPIQRDGLKAWGDWITHNVGYSGYRFDYTQGIEPWFISEYMRGRIKRDRFAVMEYWTLFKDATTLENISWLDLVDNTACLFDFALQEKLTLMCNDSLFDVSTLVSNALIWSRPNRTVTFVESHDTIRPKGTDDKWGIETDKMLAYAFILIADGLPMVAYNDYMIGPYASPVGNGWTGTPLKAHIDKLIDIRRTHVGGKMTCLPVTNRAHLLIIKRSGGERKIGCILTLNNSFSALSDTVATGWPNTTLIDLLDENTVVQTDGAGIVTLNAPARGYRIYAPAMVLP